MGKGPCAIRLSVAVGSLVVRLGPHGGDPTHYEYIGPDGIHSNLGRSRVLSEREAPMAQQHVRELKARHKTLCIKTYAKWGKGMGYKRSKKKNKVRDLSLSVLLTEERCWLISLPSQAQIKANE